MDEPEPARSVRGLSLALAEYWLITIKDSPAKTKALALLADATDLACAAVTG